MYKGGRTNDAGMADGEARGYSYHHGPPTLVCSAPWALTQLRTMDPHHPAVLAASAALEAADRGALSIAVHWGALARARGPTVELTVREQACDEPIARVRAAFGEPCALTIRARAPGSLYVAQLAPAAHADAAERWSRTLHVLAPFPAAWRNQQHVCFTRLTPRLFLSLAELRAMAAPVDGLGAPTERGFGIELELLSAPPDAERGFFSKAAELGALLDAAERTATAAPEPERAELTRIVRRMRSWQISLDPACLPFPRATAEALVPQMRALGAADDEDALAMLTLRSRTTPTEFKSPLPPHELSFGTAGGGSDAARLCASAEAALGVRLIGMLAVCAPSVSESGCECNTALHVHVNVRDARAAGRLLSAREILSVWIAWVRFEHVTARLGRSWCWADRWAAPLYATGSEFTFSERPLARGTAAHLERGAANDARAFFTHAHARAAELGTLVGADEAARVAHLFGDGCELGKYCSLNLLPLRTYGTVEFRRRHASTDARSVVRWARVCVAFVEAFADERLLAPYLGVDAHDGLLRLQREQLLATTDELIARLDAHCAARELVASLRADCCGPHVAAGGEGEGTDENARRP
ncbi:hypothetical protein KFE25_012178 [Diacronema lutheri]|uniref:Uncharacterized protein n=1 Tax=Diacronema lutheri TaxID=2081491 RepID=A0A8J5XEE8_DIALT|nr:hypothetical protein KFE25_012178 [Diacronema lutheri]